MRNPILPAVILAVGNVAWILYGASTGWPGWLIALTTLIWVAVVALCVRQAMRHA